jgi:hypothetical protein
VNEGQREQWRKALAAKAAAGRRRPAVCGVRKVKGVGMVRILPPKSERATERLGSP